MDVIAGGKARWRRKQLIYELVDYFECTQNCGVKKLRAVRVGVADFRKTVDEDADPVTIQIFRQRLHR